MEVTTPSCPDCGQKILVSNPTEPIPWTPILIVEGIIGVSALASVVIPRFRS